MVQKQRTRTFRRMKVTTPGGAINVHYIKRKPKIAHCAVCHKALQGVPRLLPYQVRQLSISEKRPERPFGGKLCSECMRNEIKNRFNISKQMPLEIGQVCVKTAGKEAGKICVIVDKLDDIFVMIDGQTKRKRCNVAHLATLEQSVDIKKNATHEEVASALKSLKIDSIQGKSKVKKQKPAQKRKQSEKKVAEKVVAKKPTEKKPVAKKPVVKKETAKQ